MEELTPVLLDCDDENLELAREAFRQWAPKAIQIDFRKLTAGFSGASVYRVDVSNPNESDLRSGCYILKFASYSKWSDQQDEAQAHVETVDFARDFAQRHIPALIKTFLPDREKSKGYALLYDIAGASLDQYHGTDLRECWQFRTSVGRITLDLLDHWVDKEPREKLSPDKLLKRWLGYRINPTANAPVQILAKSIFGEKNAIVVAGEAIPNPIEFVRYAEAKKWKEDLVFNGRLHGDMHGGNIIVKRFNHNPEDYWIIDLGMASRGPVGFDQSYMEMAQIIYCLAEHDPSQLLRVLALVDRYPDRSLPVPPGTSWLIECLHEIRQSVASWMNNRHSRRLDMLNRQFLFARIAAGINWANKPMVEESRLLGLYYAGWAAAEYLRRYEGENAHDFWQSQSQVSVSDNSIDELWNEFWQNVQGFSQAQARYVLIAEGLGTGEELRALGKIPWSVVIDLDPYSDSRGLHKTMSAVLETYRGVHQFSRKRKFVDMGRATAWVMANGWTLRRESWSSLDEWRFNQLPIIRELMSEFDRQTSPLPVYVIILPGATYDKAAPTERLVRTIDACYEGTHGRAKFFKLGSSHVANKEVVSIPVSIEDSLRQFANTLGVSAAGLEVTVPGQIDGKNTQRQIPVDSLRVMEENFELLHSKILEKQSPDQQSIVSPFWRGQIPTWFDLHSNADISRSITDELIENLKTQLDGHRNHTVVLYHNPGAGGTTVALRVAWTLSRDYPTAVLHTWSEALPDRLESLYNKTEKPILLVAESSVLLESPREDLYREMSRRNVRVVLLYVRRVFKGKPRGLCLFDPMDAEESQAFLQKYNHLTDDPKRRKELDRITYEEASIRYRSPFFYGLITFAREFVGTEAYVTHHLRGVRRKAMTVLEYLALLTIYCSTGLSEVLLRRMFGISGDQQSLTIEDLLGTPAARLVTLTRGRYRLMHQVIAEEVLSHLNGANSKNWKQEVFHLAKDLIRELSQVEDPDSLSVREMLRQLFTERQDGDFDGIEDRQQFSPLIEDVDSSEISWGHLLLKELTDSFPTEPHFWNHLGRHQIYRLGTDHAKAEEYLLRAIDLSQGADFIHFHTLGLVRRSLVRETMGDRSISGIASMMQALKPHFDGAAECFEKTRQLNPENLYGYITHIQMIVEVARRLVSRSKVSNVAELKGEQGEWVRENLPLANELVSEAQQLYGTLEEKKDRYLRRCVSSLHGLYGDIDRAIELLSQQQAGGKAAAIDRRSLAHALYVRSDRNWASMQQAELREIVRMMEQNLRSSGQREEDYRLWFEAFKLLPEFDFDQAIAQLKLWTENFPSWRAHYYISVLYFVLWLERRTLSTDELEEELDKCQKVFFGRRNNSLLWLARSTMPCPLVSTSELGTYDRMEGFWKNTGALRRVNGVIESIKGAQSGQILIDGQVEAFFVPGKSFFRHQDEDRPVNFFLGFSATGLRAWGVAAGHIEDGDRTLPGVEATEPVHIPMDRPDLTESIRQTRLRQLQLERVRSFIEDYVKVRLSIGAEVEVDEIRQRVEAVFGIDDLFELIETDLLSILDGFNTFFVAKTNEKSFIRSSVVDHEPERRSPETKRIFGVIQYYNQAKRFGFIEGTKGERYHFNFLNLGKGAQVPARYSLVEFSSQEDEQGLHALAVRILPDDESLKVIQNFISELVERNDGKPVSLVEVANSLNDAFLGLTTIRERLGFTSTALLVNSIPTLRIKGERPDLFVTRVEDPIGRLGTTLPPHVARRDVELTDSVKSGTVKSGTVKSGTAKSGTAMTSVTGAGGLQSVSLHGKSENKKGSTPTKEPVVPRSTGVVKFVNLDKEFGVILGDDGKKYYFKFARLRFDSTSLRKKLPVDFRARRHVDRDLADDIRLRQDSGPSGQAGSDGSEGRAPTPPNKSVEDQAHAATCILPENQRARIVAFIKQKLMATPGMHIETLAHLVLGQLPGNGRLAEKLGCRFRDFLVTLPPIHFSGNPDHPLVQWVAPEHVSPSKESRIHSEQRKQHPDTPTSSINSRPVLSEGQRVSLVSFIETCLRRYPEMPLETLAAKVGEQLPGDGRLAQKLGYPRFRDFLESIPEIRLTGNYKHPLVSWEEQIAEVTVGQPASVSLDGQIATEPSVSNTRSEPLTQSQLQQSVVQPGQNKVNQAKPLVVDKSHSLYRDAAAALSRVREALARKPINKGEEYKQVLQAAVDAIWKFIALETQPGVVLDGQLKAQAHSTLVKLGKMLFNCGELVWAYHLGRELFERLPDDQHETNEAATLAAKAAHQLQITNGFEKFDLHGVKVFCESVVHRLPGKHAQGEAEAILRKLPKL